MTGRFKLFGSVDSVGTRQYLPGARIILTLQRMSWSAWHMYPDAPTLVTIIMFLGWVSPPPSQKTSTSDICQRCIDALPHFYMLYLASYKDDRQS